MRKEQLALIKFISYFDKPKTKLTQFFQAVFYLTASVIHHQILWPPVYTTVDGNQVLPSVQCVFPTALQGQVH